MIFKIDYAAIFFIKFQKYLSAESTVNDNMRIKFINNYFFNHIVIKLSEFHLTKGHFISINFNHTLASLQNTPALNPCLFNLYKKFSFSDIN
jgi:hypothetical protein